MAVITRCSVCEEIGPCTRAGRSAPYVCAACTKAGLYAGPAYGD